MRSVPPSNNVQPVAQAELNWADPVFLEDLRRQMLKFATLQLRDAHLAEDAVQEALIGAMKNASSFKREASLKTWVFAILKNKIADTLRQRQRLVEASRLLGSDQEEDDLNELFDRKGFWQPDERPGRWNGPNAALEDQQFWRVFEACLSHLPDQQARVFMMREFVEMEPNEVCKEVGITTSNLHVTLYRARLRLRECLENRWFQGGAVA